MKARKVLPAGSTFRAFTDELLERQAGQHEPTVSGGPPPALHPPQGPAGGDVCPVSF